MKRCLLIRPFLILWSFNKKKKKLTNTSSEVVANFFLEGEHDDKIKFYHHIPESIFPYQKWKYTIFICLKNEVKFSFKSVHILPIATKFEIFVIQNCWNIEFYFILLLIASKVLQGNSVLDKSIYIVVYVLMRDLFNFDWVCLIFKGLENLFDIFMD